MWQVLSFADYMSATHAFFDDVFLGVYDTELELEAAAVDGTFKVWAVVAFHSGPIPAAALTSASTPSSSTAKAGSKASAAPAAAGADYSIRMPLMGVPKTWIRVNKFRSSEGNRPSNMYKK